MVKHKENEKKVKQVRKYKMLRISEELYNQLREMGKKSESWDALFRRLIFK